MSPIPSFAARPSPPHVHQVDPTSASHSATRVSNVREYHTIRSSWLSLYADLGAHKLLGAKTAALFSINLAHRPRTGGAATHLVDVRTRTGSVFSVPWVRPSGLNSSEHSSRKVRRRRPNSMGFQFDVESSHIALSRRQYTIHEHIILVLPACSIAVHLLFLTHPCSLLYQPGKRNQLLSDLMSDGFIEAKRVYVALLIVCIACLVLSSGNRKKMLSRAPSRANHIELSS